MRSALFLAAALTAPAVAADPPAFDRSIGKQPKYAGKPKYALLVFGPAAKDRAWLVRDGDTLHVDRNGNGDLTDPGEAVTAEPDGDARTFEVREITTGGRTHRLWTARFYPLAVYADIPDWKAHPAVVAALKADPKAAVASVRGAVASDRVKGGGPNGRVECGAGPLDADGPLVFADSPAAAPVIWCDGPLTMGFDGPRPVFRAGRTTDVVLALGTRGVGPGTFAAISYDRCIPKGVKPVVELALPPKTPGGSPVTVRAELPDRC